MVMRKLCWPPETSRMEVAKIVEMFPASPSVAFEVEHGGSANDPIALFTMEETNFALERTKSKKIAP